MGDSRSLRNTKSNGPSDSNQSDHLDAPQASETEARSLWLSEIATQLYSLAREMRTASTMPLSGDGQSASPSVARPAPTPDAIANRDSFDRKHFAGLARQIYQMRRQRSTIFGDTDLFGEPAWDILLDLYIAAAEGKSVSVSSACIGSAAPPTTGLRWLGVLAHQGLVIREHDPNDQRRVHFRLSETSLLAMDRFFNQTIEQSRSP